jgi:cholesterol oxidase
VPDDAGRPFDAVVVGSGFGGAVTALRLAQAEWRVCVLERGRPWPQGSFPRTPHTLGRDGFWAPHDGRHGLFEVWSFSGLSALVASGLGGGSLIYANVMLPKPPETFVDDERESWPVSRADLERHYANVEAVQRPTPYPIEHEPYASTPKTRAMIEVAAELDLEHDFPPLAVLFAADGEDPAPGEPIPGERTLHHRPRTTCRLCGECDIGCNYGAKQTLDHTYLTLAKRAGAQLRTLCEVTAIGHADEGGYEVTYRQHVSARDGHDPELLDPTTEPQRTIRAHHVVLAAGALGSTRLLLANRARLPGLSPMLGKRFSANGDYIGFARDCRDGDDWRYLEHSVGPVITTSLPVPAERSASGRGYYVQDAGGPAFAEFLWQAAEVPEDLWKMLPIVRRRIVERLRGKRDTNLSDELAALFGSAHASAAMLPLLGMGRDTPSGVLRLTDGRLELDWDQDDSDAHYDALRDTFRDVARELGGELMEPPFARVTTVHPVGGCAMARSAREGVVDPWGEVFGHPGLHVADGAVMPGPVGPNPSFTIAAVADRFAELMIERGRPT